MAYSSTGGGSSSSRPAGLLGGQLHSGTGTGTGTGTGAASTSPSNSGGPRHQPQCWTRLKQDLPLPPPPQPPPAPPPTPTPAHLSSLSLSLSHSLLHPNPTCSSFSSYPLLPPPRLLPSFVSSSSSPSGPEPTLSLFHPAARDFHIHYIHDPHSGLRPALDSPLLSPQFHSTSEAPFILEKPPRPLPRPRIKSSNQFGRFFRTARVVETHKPKTVTVLPKSSPNRRKQSNPFEAAFSLTFAGPAPESSKQVDIHQKPLAKRISFQKSSEPEPDQEIHQSLSPSIQEAFRQTSQSSIHPAFRQPSNPDSTASVKHFRTSDLLIASPKPCRLFEPKFVCTDAAEEELYLTPFEPILTPEHLFESTDEFSQFNFEFIDAPDQGIVKVEEKSPDEMGLMRHITRSKRPETPTRNPLKGRPQISLPTELISTTNMLSYSAPSVASMRAVSSSTVSSRNSQHSTGDDSTTSEPGLTDASSLISLSSPGSPVERTCSSYFPADESTAKASTEISTVEISSTNQSYMTTADSSPAQTPAALEIDDPFTSSSTTTSNAIPALPRRAASHSKREHVRLARRRSQRPSSVARPGSTFSVDSTDSLNSACVEPAIAEHPFSQELEQLSEAVEEFGGGLVPDEDAKVMESMGLKRWRASQYLVEIRELAEGVFDGEDGWLC